VVSEEGLPLGLLGAATLLRDDETFGTAATRKRRPIGEKESHRWLAGYLRTQALAERLPHCEVFSISDREGDIHEVYEAWRDAGEGPRAEWIVRAKQNRALARVEAARDRSRQFRHQDLPVGGILRCKFSEILLS
jgi:hypothetical protein